jgi:hypothetical protein
MLIRGLILTVTFTSVRYRTYAEYLASDLGLDVRVAAPSELQVVAFYGFQAERQVDSSRLP